MITERECQATLAHLEQEVDGFVGAAFVEISSGRKLAGHSVQPAFDLTGIAAAARLTIAAHHEVSGIALDEIVVTDNEYIHLYRPVTPAVCLTVSALRSETNIAMLRVAVRRRSDRFSMPSVGSGDPQRTSGAVTG